jgi:hypothetical protein
MAETTENREKIGAKVDESVYAEFKQHVFEATGQKRGVLGEAVEAALLQYMEDDGRDVDDDVSNADLLREIRALRSSDSVPAPHPPAEESDSKVDSADSPGSDGSPSPTDDAPTPPPGSNKGSLTDGEEKPSMNTPVGERVAWLASEINIEGRVPFSTLTREVNEKYPEHSSSKVRELAWEWAAVRAPTRDEFPDESEYVGDTHLDTPARDARLRNRAEAENEPLLMTCPRRHKNGAWFRISEAYGAMNHQEPTERGDVDVYLGEGGARTHAEEMGLIESELTDDDSDDGDDADGRSWDSYGNNALSSVRSGESGDSNEDGVADESVESDGISSDGSKEDTDSDGGREDLEAEADAEFAEFEEGDRGREY